MAKSDTKEVSKLYGVVGTGNPGVGKSMFGFYIIAEILHRSEKKDLVCCCDSMLVNVVMSNVKSVGCEHTKNEGSGINRIEGKICVEEGKINRKFRFRNSHTPGKHRSFHFSDFNLPIERLCDMCPSDVV